MPRCSVCEKEITDSESIQQHGLCEEHYYEKYHGIVEKKEPEKSELEKTQHEIAELQLERLKREEEERKRREKEEEERRKREEEEQRIEKERPGKEEREEKRSEIGEWVKFGLFMLLAFALVTGFRLAIKDHFPKVAYYILIFGYGGIGSVIIWKLSSEFVPKEFQNIVNWVLVAIWVVAIGFIIYREGLIDLRNFVEFFKSIPKEWDILMCKFKMGISGGDPNECEGEKEVGAEKIGSYETLDFKSGLKVGDEFLPVKKPVAGEEYTLEFTLTNKNSPESGFDINITKIEAYALSKPYSKESDLEDAPHVSEEVLYTLWPQMYKPIRLKFDELPPCQRYMYFFINVTTRQSGGGQAKYGMVPTERGYEDFVYKFDPEIKTNPGPLDIYVYTYPFAIVFDETKAFDVIIKLVNRGKTGVGYLDEIKLIQTFENLPSPDEENYPFFIESCDKPSEESVCEDGKPGNCRTITESFTLPKDEVNEISCRATKNTGNEPFGKVTDFISVLSEYDYVQEFSTPPFVADCGTTTTTTTTQPLIGGEEIIE